MKSNEPIGMNELMIVNPCYPGGSGIFLGQDGNFYQVQGLGQDEELRGIGQFFLGEDNALYQVQGLGQNALPVLAAISAVDIGKLGRYFLGEDGTLYQVTR